MGVVMIIPYIRVQAAEPQLSNPAEPRGNLYSAGAGRDGLGPRRQSRGDEATLVLYPIMQPEPWHGQAS